MSQQVVIGMMDSAYFANRNCLLKWINDTLKLDVTHIEDLGSGAVYCQLLDAAFKHSINMNKVNWKAKFEYEFIGNLKLFQQTLERLGIAKKIDIEKLAKAKYQDNLEIIQWLKRYIEVTGKIDPNYNPQARRNNANLLSNHQCKKILGSSFKLNRSLNSSSTNLSVCAKHKIPNKENVNPLETDLLEKIKETLLSSSSSDSKVAALKNIIFNKASEDSQNKQSVLNTALTEIDEDEVF